MQVKSNKHNWREFCTEKPLSDQELQQWYDARARLQLNEDVQDYVYYTTEKELKEYLKKANAVGDWLDLANEIDASRRLRRAIKAVQMCERRNNV